MAFGFEGLTSGEKKSAAMSGVNSKEYIDQTKPAGLGKLSNKKILKQARAGMEASDRTDWFNQRQQSIRTAADFEQSATGIAKNKNTGRNNFY